MRKCRVLLAFLIVLVLALGVSAYGAGSAAPGSFLKQRVDSAQALANQVSSDKLVAARYTQHFKMSKQSVVNYFQNNLKLSTLRKPTVTTVYYINKSGKVVKGKRLLPAGTAVFTTKTGEPILDWRCGNPLRASLPVPAKNTAAAKKPTVASAGNAQKPVTKVAAVQPETPVQVAQTPVVEKVLPSPPTEIAALPFATAPAIVAETVAPAVVTATPNVAPPVVEAIATAPVEAVPPVIASSSKGGFGFLLPLALLGGVGAAVSGGGGSSGGGTPPPTVPEPSSLVAMAAGLMATAGYVIRKSRR